VSHEQKSQIATLRWIMNTIMQLYYYLICSFYFSVSVYILMAYALFHVFGISFALKYQGDKTVNRKIRMDGNYFADFNHTRESIRII
jgi:hypothetical protein